MPNRKHKTSSRRGPSRRADASKPLLNRFLVITAIVMVFVIVGLGFVSWSHTPLGQASLLTLGRKGYLPDMQQRVGESLAKVIPGYVAGDISTLLVSAEPVFQESAYDWSSPQFGPGHEIRCRIVFLPPETDFWEFQADISEALVPVGARILWSERLHTKGDSRDFTDDILHLDLGVPGYPTHTLLISPRTTIQNGFRWGVAAQQPTLEDLLGDPDQPTIAIVVDDWGYYDNVYTRGFLNLKIPLTLSILPDKPLTRRFALCATGLALPAEDGPALMTAALRGLVGGSNAWIEQLRKERAGPVVFSFQTRHQGPPSSRRREVILHQPMEPVSYPESDPGEPMLAVGMSEAEIDAILDRSLRLLPGVRGLNNHMGSAATSDSQTMRRLMNCLRSRDLFFLDSMTSSSSVGVEEALRAGVPVISNFTFLDQAETSRDQVKSLLARLVRKARASGSAVGLCHPYPVTVDILREELPKYRDSGIRFVTISELMALRLELSSGI